MSWWVLGSAGILWLVLALFLVPWHPVPGGTPPPVSAAEIFNDTYLQRAHGYATPVRYLAWSSLAVSLVVAVLLGCSSRVRAWIGRWRGPWPLQVLGAAAVINLIGWLLTCPFGVLIWRRQVEAGLSGQGLVAWLRDQAIGWLLQWVVAAIVLVVVIGCARRLPRTWPAVAGGVLAGLVVAGSWVYPVLVEPLFNDFTSLPSGALRTEVMELAKQEGVRVDDVLVADASRRTTTLNAYVSGFGSSRRVVLYDTLVDSTPPAEIRTVVAHELAHAKNNDVLLGTALGAVGVLLAVAALGAVTSVRRGGGASLKDARAVPALLAAVAVGTVLVAPLQNGISRAIETRADVVALQTTGDGAGFVRMQKQLAVRSLTDPNSPAWSRWWFGTHPGVLQRIAIGQQWER